MKYLMPSPSNKNFEQVFAKRELYITDIACRAAILGKEIFIPWTEVVNWI